MTDSYGETAPGSITLSGDARHVYRVDARGQILSTHRSKDAAVRAHAMETHVCPKDYDGPCWGPTDDELAAAREALGLAAFGRTDAEVQR